MQGGHRLRLGRKIIYLAQAAVAMPECWRRWRGSVNSESLVHAVRKFGGGKTMVFGQVADTVGVRRIVFYQLKQRMIQWRARIFEGNTSVAWALLTKLGLRADQTLATPEPSFPSSHFPCSLVFLSSGACLAAEPLETIAMAAWLHVELETSPGLGLVVCWHPRTYRAT